MAPRGNVASVPSSSMDVEAAGGRGRAGSYPTAQREVRPASVAAVDTTNTYVVMGIQFDDPEAATLARRVMSIASTMSLLALISVILQFFIGFYFSIGITASIIVPLCGYCGAANRSRTAMWWFILCNVILAAVFLGSFAVTLVNFKGDLVSCACSRSCSGSYFSPVDAASICSDSGYYRSLFWIAMAFGFAMVVLQFMGCVEGYKLVKCKHFKLHSHVPVAEQVVTTRAYYPSDHHNGATPLPPMQPSYMHRGYPGEPPAQTTVYMTSPQPKVVYQYADGRPAPAPINAYGAATTTTVYTSPAAAGYYGPTAPTGAVQQGYTYAVPPPPQSATRGRSVSQEPGVVARGTPTAANGRDRAASNFGRALPENIAPASSVDGATPVKHV